MISTEGAKAGTRNRIVVARNHAGRRSWTSSKSGVAAEHRNTGAVFGTTKRHHVLADVTANEFAVMRTAVGQDMLDEIISKLITGNYRDVSKNTQDDSGRMGAYYQ